MMKAIIDINIIVDYLNGIEKARNELARYQKPMISIITWMEIMIGAKIDDDELILLEYLSCYQLISINVDIAKSAVSIRKNRKIKLPDAIIQAMAEVEEVLLITRNIKDFPESLPFIRIPYSLGS